MADVRLVDLEVIKRYSLAIRQEYADAEELLAALEADREELQKLTGASSQAARRSGAAAKRSPAKKSAAKKAPAKKSPAKKRPTAKGSTAKGSSGTRS